MAREKENNNAEASNTDNSNNKKGKRHYPSKLPLAQISKVRPYGKGGAFIAVPLAWIDYRVSVELAEPKNEDEKRPLIKEVRASGTKRANVYLPTTWIGRNAVVNLIEFPVEKE